MNKRIKEARKKFEEAHKLRGAGLNAKQISTVLRMSGHEKVKPLTVSSYLKFSKFEDYTEHNKVMLSKYQKKVVKQVSEEKQVDEKNSTPVSREDLNKVLDLMAEAYEKIKSLKFRME